VKQNNCRLLGVAAIEVSRKLQSGRSRRQHFERGQDGFRRELRGVRAEKDVVNRVNFEQHFGVAQMMGCLHIEAVLRQHISDKSAQVGGLVEQQYARALVLPTALPCRRGCAASGERQDCIFCSSVGRQYSGKPGQGKEI